MPGDVTVAVHFAIGETAVGIDQDRSHGVAETTAHGPEPVDFVFFRQSRERDREKGKEAGILRQHPRPAGDQTVPLVPHAAALDVRFKAGEPSWRELPIVANLAAADHALRIE